MHTETDTATLVNKILDKMRAETLGDKMGISKEKIMLWSRGKRNADKADFRWLEDIARRL
jgi:hypothetical protein